MIDFIVMLMTDTVDRMVIIKMLSIKPGKSDDSKEFSKFFAKLRIVCGTADWCATAMTVSVGNW